MSCFRGYGIIVSKQSLIQFRTHVQLSMDNALNKSAACLYFFTNEKTMLEKMFNSGKRLLAGRQNSTNFFKTQMLRKAKIYILAFLKHNQLNG